MTEEDARRLVVAIANLRAAAEAVLAAVYVGNGQIVCPPVLEKPLRDLAKAMRMEMP